MFATLIWLLAAQQCGSGAAKQPVTTASGSTASPKSTGTTTGSTPTGTGVTTTGTGTTTGGTTTGAATGTGTTRSTPTTSTVEQCGDGVDNDSDGLLDCEDDDCLGDAACTELVCDDLVDDDGDGLIDCADEDCWGNGCAVALAAVTQSAASFRYGSGRQLIYYGNTPACSSSYSFTQLVEGFADVGHTGVQGTVRVIDRSASQWTSCGWTADSSWVEAANDWRLYEGDVHDLHRTNFALSSGCPLTSSSAALLPQQARIGEIWAATKLEAVDDSAVWFEHNTGNPVFGSYTFDEFLINYAYFGCGYQYWYYHQTSFTADPATPGDELLTIRP